MVKEQAADATAKQIAAYEGNYYDVETLVRTYACQHRIGLMRDSEELCLCVCVRACRHARVSVCLCLCAQHLMSMNHQCC